ncbi:MAG: type III polyketide synthase [Anaerolineae bacterium]
MTNDQARVALLGLGTAVPKYRYSHEATGRWLAESPGTDRAVARLLRSVFAASAIDTIHAVLPDFFGPPQNSRMAPGRALEEIATTAERMQIYQREAPILGRQAAERALADSGHPSAADTVTHLVVVSCTGFFAPGLDQAIAIGLGLGPHVQRTMVGFMGCAAAFNGLRLADQIVRAQPSARVLVVCVELSSLHIPPRLTRDYIIAAALFADGAGACLVGAPPPDGREHFALDNMHSMLAPDTRQHMVWEIGNHGFSLYLSPEIPQRLGQVAPGALRTLLDGRPMPRAWAVHPGGRAIVDKLAEVFELTPDDLASTYAVLRDYGNMSSPTILFVLRELRERLRREAAEPTSVAAMAFGPGLVVEMAHLTYEPVVGAIGSPGTTDAEAAELIGA